MLKYPPGYGISCVSFARIVDADAIIVRAGSICSEQPQVISRWTHAASIPPGIGCGHAVMPAFQIDRCPGLSDRFFSDGVEPVDLHTNVVTLWL